MAHGAWMRRYARWHIWLGWLVSVPLLLWTLSGVAMVARPIEEVRGEHLRIPVGPAALSRNPRPIDFQPGSTRPLVELRTFVQRGRAVTLARDSEGRVSRYDAATGALLPPLDEQEARDTVAATIRGGRSIVAMQAFAGERPPLDLRKSVPAWRATLTDGTHVYVNRDSGEIEAVRTRWWRIYDVLWGIHIMDLQTREDAHNPFTLAFGSLAFVGALLGFVLLFRRRKARVSP